MPAASIDDGTQWSQMTWIGPSSLKTISTKFPRSTNRSGLLAGVSGLSRPSRPSSIRLPPWLQTRTVCPGCCAAISRRQAAVSTLRRLMISWSPSAGSKMASSASTPISLAFALRAATSTPGSLAKGTSSFSVMTSTILPKPSSTDRMVSRQRPAGLECAASILMPCSVIQRPRARPLSSSSGGTTFLLCSRCLRNRILVKVTPCRFQYLASWRCGIVHPNH